MARWIALCVSFTTLTCAVAAWDEPPDSVQAHRRAGQPQEVSRWARPSDTGRYTGYLVGGGAVPWRRGDAPTAAEGTWGWDYAGGWSRRRVVPGWFHGRRYQGGVGAYATDGPTLLPRLK